jgi:hypothetical protein
MQVNYGIEGEEGYLLSFMADASFYIPRSGEVVIIGEKRHKCDSVVYDTNTNEVTVWVRNIPENQSMPQINADIINYPFEDDPDLIGSWGYVDFVQSIELFNPSQRTFLGEPYVTTFKALPDGVVHIGVKGGEPKLAVCTWTRGKILNPADETCASYSLQEIDGTTYLFMEWKNGDYSFRNETPRYYVFQKEEL